MVTVKNLRVGAEITGVDLSKPLDEATANKIRETYNERHLLLFPKQDISILDQWRAVSLFGTILNESQDGSGAIYVSGEKTKIESNRLLFHSDNHFTQVPIDLISLYAEEVDETATSTLFVDNAETYRDLPQRIKDKIDSAEVTTRTYFHRGFSDRPARMISEAEDDSDGPIAHHPAVWRHKVTGEPFVYLTELHAQVLSGMSRAESDKLLDEIFETMYQPARFYEHKWRTGDYLLWDNKIIQHARGEIRNVADGTSPPRSIRRVASGSVGFAEQFQFSEAALERMGANRSRAYAN